MTVRINRRLKYSFALRLLLTLALLQILAACTTISKVPVPDDVSVQRYQTRQQQLQTLQHWQLRARIGIRTAENGGSATLLWQQTPQHVDLQLRGPLGTQLVTINGGDQNYRLIDRKGREWWATNIEQLIIEHTGWLLPINHLRYWVLGLATLNHDTISKSAEALQINPDGSLAVLRHNKWRIEYQRYTQYGAYLLPTKVTAQHPDISIKMIIKDWKYD